MFDHTKIPLIVFASHQLHLFYISILNHKTSIPIYLCDYELGTIFNKNYLVVIIDCGLKITGVPTFN